MCFYLFVRTATPPHVSHSRIESSTPPLKSFMESMLLRPHRPIDHGEEVVLEINSKRKIVLGKDRKLIKRVAEGEIRGESG